MNPQIATFALALGLLLSGPFQEATASDLKALPDLGGVPTTPATHADATAAVRTCTKCHDETESKPVLSILKSRHAVMADPRTPFADQACMSCHGASNAHVKGAPGANGKRTAPDVGVGKQSPTPVGARNEVCMGCHENNLRMHWKGSKHEAENVACASCHTAHAQSDPVLASTTQTEVCVACHKGRRAEMLRPSTHPLRDGQMSCSGCHNPHGSNGPRLLTQNTVNETCYTCHAEKRGPFLWEHAPVREDCTICHKPHGSVNASLLQSRVPYLCQQCHLAPQHPSSVYSGTGLPGAAIPSGAQQLLAKGCLNCHSQVHGSNHPSGVRKTR